MSVEAIVQSQAIAVGFTAKVNDEETVFEFPAHSELIKELENLFEVDFSGELEFFLPQERAAKFLRYRFHLIK